MEVLSLIRLGYLKDAHCFVLKQDLVEQLNGYFAIAWNFRIGMGKLNDGVDVSADIMVLFIAF